MHECLEKFYSVIFLNIVSIEIETAWLFCIYSIIYIFKRGCIIKRYIFICSHCNSQFHVNSRFYCFQFFVIFLYFFYTKILYKILPPIFEELKIRTVLKVILGRLTPQVIRDFYFILFSLLTTSCRHNKVVVLSL